MWTVRLVASVTGAVLLWSADATLQTRAPATDDGSVVVFARNQMIPMRDGVKLATDIYRPAAAGVPIADRLPILLQRTPYDKTAAGAVQQARYFASHGYVVALQDERGAYHSEGVQSKYVGYGQDGYDTIEWLAGLPYTDGQVAMWGTSYAAHTEAGAAILHPPHLKTIVLNCGGLYNAWLYKVRNHGAFELAQQTTWAFGQLPEREKAANWIGAMARGQTPLARKPSFEDYYFEIMTHADYDDYWKQPDRNWSLYYEQTSDIPMLHLTGWYDSYTSGSILNYQGLSKIKKSPIKLMVGPWVHGGNTRSNAGDVEFGPTAAIGDFNEAFHLRWFDRFLKGRETGADTDPAVRLFVMGTGDGHKDPNGRMFHGGYWRTSSTWPLPETTFTNYYFHGDGTLSTTPAQAGDAPTKYTYDPAHPVPTIGGSFSGTADLSLAGAFDQREQEKGAFGSKPPYLRLRARPDVVVFQTAALTQDTAVIGPIVVKLYAASTAVDTDFTAKLVDVYPANKDYPSGYEMNLTDGIMRARYRNSPERAELMKPGIVYELQIEPFPTANVFKKGHRIRIDVSSSNFPRFDANPNTGEPLGLSRRTATADNSVYHDAKYPSSVTLPIVALSAAPPTAEQRPQRGR